MAQKEHKQVPTEQVNIRVPRWAYDVLRALMFLDDKASVTEVLRPVVQQFLATQAEDEEVRAVMEALERRQGKMHGTLASLSEKVQQAEQGA